MLRIHADDLIGKSVFRIFGNQPHVVKDARRALAANDFTSQVEIGDATLEVHFSPSILQITTDQNNSHCH